MCTVKNIPIHTLKRSGLFPALDLLAELWARNCCEPSYLFKSSKTVRTSVFIALIISPFLALGILVSPLTELRTLALILFICVWMIAVFFILESRFARRFAADIETFCSIMGSKVMYIPAEQRPFATFLKREYYHQTLRIYRAEKTHLAEAEAERKKLKLFIEILARFNIRLDPNELLDVNEAFERFESVNTGAFAVKTSSTAA